MDRGSPWRGRPGTRPWAQYSLDRIGVPKGIRTPVTAVKGRCPWPLDDGDKMEDRWENPLPCSMTVEDGGARRDRTADLLHAMQALSQLSYGPIDRRRAM